MKFRVHFLHQGKRLTGDFAAESEEQAGHACRHHNHGCQVTKVEPLNPPAARSPVPRPALPAAPAEGRATDEQRRAFAHGLRAFREGLAADHTEEEPS